MKTLKIHSLLNTSIPPQQGDPTHVLLLVHGRTGNLRLLQWYAKRFALPGLAYLSVQAPYPERRPDQSDEGFSWYVKNYDGLEKSREALRSAVEEITQQGFRSQQIFWLGFSQGAAMGLDFALRSNFQLGGFLCISGFCIRVEDYPKAFGAFAKKQRILVTHGTRDPILPMEESEPDYRKLQELGVPLEFQIFDKPHSFHLKTEVPLLESQLQKWMAEPIA